MKTYNLIYFVGAIDRPMLWLNLQWLKQYLHLFNGRKFVTICRMGDDEATQHYTNLNAEEYQNSVVQADRLITRIREYLNDPSIEYYEIENSMNKEAPLFGNGPWQEIANTNPNEATFYGHTKGVRYPGLDPAMVLWATTMLFHNFTLCDAMHDALWTQGKSCAGTLKYIKPAFLADPGGPYPWHYSGAMFWFRHDNFFSKDWIRIDNSAYVMEYLMPRLFSSEEAYAFYTLPDTISDPAELYKLAGWEKAIGTKGIQSIALFVSGCEGTLDNLTFTQHLK